MRDANGNEFAGTAPLKDAGGNPIRPVALSPREKSTVEALESARRALDEVTRHLTKLMADHEALAKEHADTQRDISRIAQAYTELKAKQTEPVVAEPVAEPEVKPANGKKKAAPKD